MQQLLAQPLSRLPHHLHRAAQAYHASLPEAPQQRGSRLTARAAEPPDFDKSSWKVETKLLADQLRSAQREQHPARPWSFLVPSLEEMRRRDWPQLVKDWPMFWALFNKWLEYECDTRPRDRVQDLPYDSEKSRAHGRDELEASLDSNFTIGSAHGNMVAERLEEYHNWFQISDRSAVITAIRVVGGMVNQLASQGTPMPMRLTYLEHVGDAFMPDPMRPALYEAQGVVYHDADPVYEKVEKLGYNWDALDLRAHVEKRKAKAQRELEYMAERAQEFRFDYMDVSQATDARLQAEPQLVGQDFTHQEFMDYILRGKQEPFIPMMDPTEVQDLAEDGWVEYHPETDDYLRELGLLLEEHEQPEAMVHHSSQLETAIRGEDLEVLDTRGSPVPGAGEPKEAWEDSGEDFPRGAWEADDDTPDAEAPQLEPEREPDIDD